MSVMKRLGFRRGTSHRHTRPRLPMRPRPSAAVRLLMSMVTGAKRTLQTSTNSIRSTITGGASTPFTTALQ